VTPYRTTLFLAVVFVVLGIYVSTIEVPTMEEETAQRAEAQRLLPFDYREVTHLVYTTRTARVEMNRDHRNRWRIINPVKAKGDAREIGNVLRALEIGKISRVIQEAPTTPETYGLRSPYVQIEIRTDASTETLALGNAGPLTSTLYAQRGSDDAIVLTTLSIADFRKKSPYTFRLKDILLFDRTAAERIQLQTPDQNVTLRRGAAFHGPTSHWRFTSPIEGPADPTAVGIFLMTLDDLTATGFIDAEAEKRALLKTFHAPWLTATVHTKHAGYHVAFFQPPTPEEEAYAVTSLNDPLYRIPAHVLNTLPRRAFHLQNKRLFGMEVGEIALLTVNTEAWHYTLIQQHEEWYLEGKESDDVDQKRVKLLVSRIVDLPAELSVRLTQDNLGPYGLASPNVEIVGIDTKGRSRGLLRLGTRETGLVYATGAGLPGVYQARSIILTQIPAPDDLLKHEGL